MTSSALVVPSNIACHADVAKCDHAVLPRGFAEFVRRRVVHDHLAHLVVESHELEQPHAALVAGIVAGFAALALVDLSSP